MIYVLRNIILNFYYVIFFFLRKKCKVLYFKLPADVLLPYLEHNVIKTVSLRIDNALEFLKSGYSDTKFSKDIISGLTESQDNELKKIVKLGWLIRDIRSNGYKNPFQLLNFNTKYACHPGTDRIIVATYLLPEQKIEGIYLWYTDLEKTSIVLDYEYREIRNPISFLSLFSYNKKFRFKSVQINKDLDTRDCEVIEFNVLNFRGRFQLRSNAMFSLAKMSFENSYKNYNELFLSFHDNMQWGQIYNNLTLRDVIHFKSNSECIFSGIEFKKINGIWLAQK